MAQPKTPQRNPQRTGMNREQTRRGAAAAPAPGRPASNPLVNAAGAGGRGGRRGIVGFVGDVRSELRKVNWPSQRETANLTAVVVALSVAVGLFLGGIDYIFQELFRFLLALSGNGGF